MKLKIMIASLVAGMAVASAAGSTPPNEYEQCLQEFGCYQDREGNWICPEPGIFDLCAVYEAD